MEKLEGTCYLLCTLEVRSFFNFIVTSAGTLTDKKKVRLDH